MKKQSLLYSIVYGNKAVVACVIFTIATIIDLFLSVTLQGKADITYWHIGIRFLLCVMFVSSISIFKHFNKLPLYAVFGIHFFIALAIMIGFVWITGLFSELSPHAYIDACRTVFIIYPVLIIGCIIIDTTRTAKANRILKKSLACRDDSYQ